MELGNPAFYAGLRALTMSVEYSLSTIIFEQKNRTPSQRRPYKNVIRFYDSDIIICR